MVVQQSAPIGNTRPLAGPEEGGSGLPLTAFRALALLRIAVGAIFLWAFLDKAFGLEYATASERSWVNGGSPAGGYLGSVSLGPMESTYHSWAGDVWVDWLYMAGMFGLGVSLVAGIGLRVTALAGPLMMLFLWLGEFPPAKHASDGTPTMSPNPLVDQHVVYAVAMVVLALFSAGRVWGLARLWARLPVVSRYRWLQ
ncbi:DoxX family membrane protein [Streptomyces hoynatensis]|uniref:DoxX family membrane protein n=1 Tax=Streptomyces hoynatensis TaxID=1141874 RepID=A0A3A9YRI7_9ACTN|nr:DoxX family membrane protein [Streptomyces hoynatensis]RKN38600.1 DoxX family membrane protein [Streptomyces hoynatensis]